MCFITVIGYWATLVALLIVRKQIDALTMGKKTKTQPCVSLHHGSHTSRFMPVYCMKLYGWIIFQCEARWLYKGRISISCLVSLFHCISALLHGAEWGVKDLPTAKGSVLFQANRVTAWPVFSQNASCLKCWSFWHITELGIYFVRMQYKLDTSLLSAVYLVIVNSIGSSVVCLKVFQTGAASTDTFLSKISNGIFKCS